jgi:hypothetical protein
MIIAANAGAICAIGVRLLRCINYGPMVVMRVRLIADPGVVCVVDTVLPCVSVVPGGRANAHCPLGCTIAFSITPFAKVTVITLPLTPVPDITISAADIGSTTGAALTGNAVFVGAKPLAGAPSTVTVPFALTTTACTVLS